jgi:hypothetical protein
VRVCSWAVRGADGPFEGVATHLQRGPRGVSRTTSGMSLPSSRETVSTCEGTGGASVGGTANGFAVPQHATRRCGVCAGMVWRWAREGGSRPAASACLTRSLQASQERGGKKRTKGCRDYIRFLGKGAERSEPNAQKISPDATLTTRPAVSSAESRSRCILRAWPPWPPWPPLN